ncbi:succinate-semialdehyde dehydrogenase [NADP(+)] [bacterium BMS3Abin02]|nr:succinate-semialdehyde dehydrogenase [NADP(+)] [bacterium BMS3Abin02]GBE21651.1 succinate-semialdehyde dehydrogenase [NADP(+)] [bacterium BMS3Bbin01]HDH26742.1 aldehyde dehydrogenase family protein [Actinomycetota bacterium]
MSETLISYDPRTGEAVGSVIVTPPQDVAAVVDRSREAFERWRTFEPTERRPYLQRLRRVVLDQGQNIAKVIQSETGKPLTEAYAFDVLTSLTVIDHYIHHAREYLRVRHGSAWPFVTTKGWTEYHPHGVAAVISPWNYPFFLPMISTVTALAAGCSVVLKPSEVTPLSGELFVDLADRAGLPEGLVQVIHGAGDTGAALVESGVDVVAFTGSTRVGKMIAAVAAEQMMPVVLELGGVDAMVVLEDANITHAARAAVWGGMTNAGQMCTSVERVYAVEPIYDAFLAEVTKQIDRIAVGTNDNRDIGPIIFEPQLAIIEAHVSDAVEKGASVIRGGRRADTPTGIYYEPTLLTGVDPGMRVMQEETFGPVLPVVRVADEAEALSMANGSSYGLHGSVWSKDRKRAKRFASRMETGTVAINDVAVNFVVPTVSFAGIKDSGQGGVFGPEGIKAFCHPLSITEARAPWPTTQLLGAWYPRRRGMRYWKALANLLFRR